MFHHLPSRKRNLIVTTITIFVLLIGTTWILWSSNTGESSRYVPGTNVEGVTTELADKIPAEYNMVKFINITGQAGIHFNHFNGKRSSQLPEDMGSGAAWVDYNQDGWPDLYIVNMPGPLTLDSSDIRNSSAHNALYRNNGDGTFTEVSKKAGVAHKGYGMGVARGDYNNDGWPDLFVTNYGENILYRNNGDGTFANVSGKAEINNKDGFWTGATWGDYNRDGWLDLYVTGYVQYHDVPDKTTMQYSTKQPASLNPSSFSPEHNLLYRNEGDGTFSEVSHQAGVRDSAGRGLTAIWTDFDNNGWPDLYVANDVSDNVLYYNQGNGKFEELSHRAQVADYRGAMGLATGDWEHDGDLDLFITHWIAQENAFYLNNLITSSAKQNNSNISSLQFQDISVRLGLGQSSLDYIGWGTSFFDFDNDTHLDLFVANGSTFEMEESKKLTPQKDQLYWNSGTGQNYFEVSEKSGPYFNEKRVGRGAAFADYDRDGDMDIYVVNHSNRGVLLENSYKGDNNWLAVRLTGKESNHSAIGARLKLYSDTLYLIREVGAQGSYLSQNSLTQHFGLGQHTNVDSLVIRWPSGLQQRIEELETNQRISIEEGSSPSTSPNPL